jgi:UrcA family protein
LAATHDNFKDLQMKKFIFFQLTFGLIGWAITMPGTATANTVQTVKVHYSDLDLAARNDVRLLGRRISRAIEKVCGSYAETAEASEIKRIDNCRRNARQLIAPQMAHLLRQSEIKLSSRTFRPGLK